MADASERVRYLSGRACVRVCARALCLMRVHNVLAGKWIGNTSAVGKHAHRTDIFLTCVPYVYAQDA